MTSDPAVFLAKSGEMEQTSSPVWDQTGEIYVASGHSANFHVSTPFVPNGAGQIVAWTAEHGAQTISVMVEHAYSQNPNGVVWYPLDADQALTTNRFGTLRFTVTSSVDQVIRVGVEPISFDDLSSIAQLRQFEQWNPRFCSPRGCDPQIETTSNDLVTTSNIADKANARAWISYVFFTISVVMLIGLSRVWELAVGLSVLIFPSAVAQELRQGDGTKGAFRRPASNSFARSKDIKELEDLLEQARTEEVRLSEIERELDAEEANDAALVHELEKAIERVKELNAMIDQQKRRN